MVNILDQSEVDALLKGVVKGEIETEVDKLKTTSAIKVEDSGCEEQIPQPG